MTNFASGKMAGNCTPIGTHHADLAKEHVEDFHCDYGTWEVVRQHSEDRLESAGCCRDPVATTATDTPAWMPGS